MATTFRDLWDGSIRTYEPDKTKTKKPKQNRQNDRYAGGPSTDIKQWLSDNGPRDYAELTDLRNALYSRRTHGIFVIKHGSPTLAGEERFLVTGRTSPLLIVSNKSRHFLLRTLCRMVRGG
jgi:hypothetical protein